MRKLVLMSMIGTVIMAGGCLQTTMHKLQSSDEAQWREGLQDVQESLSGAQRLAKVAMNKGLGHYSVDVEYPMPVRLEAVKMLGDLLDSEAMVVRGNKKYSVSQIAFDELLHIHTQVSDENIKKAVVTTFDNPGGYVKLLGAPEEGYAYGFSGRDKDASSIFYACSNDKWKIAFDFFVPYAQSKNTPDSTETILDIKEEYNRGGSSEKIAKLKSELKSREYNEKMHERAPYAMAEIYVNINEPTLEQSKQALVTCNKSLKGINPGPNGFVFTSPRDFKGESSGTSEARNLALKRIPENVLREMLPELRESDPETYWFVWGHCATPEEALKVYNSKVGTQKRKIAIARLGNESMLKEIAYGKDEELVIAAIQAMSDTKALAQYANNTSLSKECRLAAVGRLCSDELIRHNGNVDIDALWTALSSFDYSEDFARVYSTTIKTLSNNQEQSQAVQKIRDLMKVRVDRIIADGETVKDETFCCKGFRLGMYKWEFELLKAYFDVSDVDDTEYIGYTFHGHGSGEYVSYLVFKGAAVKTVFGYDSSWSHSVLQDHFTDDFGDGGNSWNYEIMGDESCRIIRVENATKTLPPRFKGRSSTSEEKSMNNKEAIRKACEVKGEIQLFFCRQNEVQMDIPQKGDVFKNVGILSSARCNRAVDCCDTSAIVKQVVDDGIIVGCVKERQRVKTGNGVPEGYVSSNSIRPGPMVPIYETFEFPNRIFIKTKKRYATGAPLSFDSDKYFKYIGTTSFKARNGTTMTFHSFEPFAMPKEVTE